MFFVILSTIMINSTEGGEHERVSSLLCKVQGQAHDEECAGCNERKGSSAGQRYLSSVWNKDEPLSKVGKLATGKPVATIGGVSF